MQVTLSLLNVACKVSWQELPNMTEPHMVRQIIQYSDGTETVVNYRGVIENGVLTEDTPEEVEEEGIVEKVVKKITKKKS